MTDVLQTFPQHLLSLLSKCLKLFHTMNPQDRNAFIQTLKANCGSLNSKSFCRPLIAGSVLPGCTVMLSLGFSALSPAGRSRPACFLATGGQGGCRWDPAERKLALEAGWNVHTRSTAPCEGGSRI